jgi:hypothetical protein
MILLARFNAFIIAETCNGIPCLSHTCAVTLNADIPCLISTGDNLPIFTKYTAVLIKMRLELGPRPSAAYGFPRWNLAIGSLSDWARLFMALR